MIKKIRKVSFLLCLSTIFLLISCNSNENNFGEIDFTKKIPYANNDYSEYLYFNNSLFGISSEVVDEEVFKDRIGKKLGDVNDINTTIKNEGDVGVEDINKEYLFRSGDGIYQIKTHQGNYSFSLKQMKAIFTLS